MKHTPPSPGRSSVASSNHSDSSRSDDSARGPEDGGVGDDCGSRDTFLCPITMSEMEDPVVASDGYTYERKAIMTYIARAAMNQQTPTSPMTRQVLDVNVLIPNRALKATIEHSNLRLHQQLQQQVQKKEEEREERRRNRRQARKSATTAGVATTAVEATEDEPPPQPLMPLLHGLERAIDQQVEQEERQPVVIKGIEIEPAHEERDPLDHSVTSTAAITTTATTTTTTTPDVLPPPTPPPTPYRVDTSPSVAETNAVLLAAAATLLVFNPSTATASATTVDNISSSSRSRNTSNSNMGSSSSTNQNSRNHNNIIVSTSNNKFSDSGCIKAFPIPIKHFPTTVPSTLFLQQHSLGTHFNKILDKFQAAPATAAGTISANTSHAAMVDVKPQSLCPSGNLCSDIALEMNSTNNKMISNSNNNNIKNNKTKSQKIKSETTPSSCPFLHPRTIIVEGDDVPLYLLAENVGLALYKEAFPAFFFFFSATSSLGENSDQTEQSSLDDLSPLARIVRGPHMANNGRRNICSFDGFSLNKNNHFDVYPAEEAQFIRQIHHNHSDQRNPSLLSPDPHDDDRQHRRLLPLALLHDLPANTGLYQWCYERNTTSTPHDVAQCPRLHWRFPEQHATVRMRCVHKKSSSDHNSGSHGSKHKKNGSSGAGKNGEEEEEKEWVNVPTTMLEVTAGLLHLLQNAPLHSSTLRKEGIEEDEISRAASTVPTTSSATTPTPSPSLPLIGTRCHYLHNSPQDLAACKKLHFKQQVLVDGEFDPVPDYLFQPSHGLTLYHMRPYFHRRLCNFNNNNNNNKYSGNNKNKEDNNNKKKNQQQTENVCNISSSSTGNSIGVGGGTGNSIGLGTGSSLSSHSSLSSPSSAPCCCLREQTTGQPCKYLHPKYVQVHGHDFPAFHLLPNSARDNLLYEGGGVVAPTARTPEGSQWCPALLMLHPAAYNSASPQLHHPFQLSAHSPYLGGLIPSGSSTANSDGYYHNIQQCPYLHHRIGHIRIHHRGPSTAVTTTTAASSTTASTSGSKKIAPSGEKGKGGGAGGDAAVRDGDVFPLCRFAMTKGLWTLLLHAAPPSPLTAEHARRYHFNENTNSSSNYTDCVSSHQRSSQCYPPIGVLCTRPSHRTHDATNADHTTCEFLHLLPLPPPVKNNNKMTTSTATTKKKNHHNSSSSIGTAGAVAATRRPSPPAPLAPSPPVPPPTSPPPPVAAALVVVAKKNVKSEPPPPPCYAPLAAATRPQPQQPSQQGPQAPSGGAKPAEEKQQVLKQQGKGQQQPVLQALNPPPIPPQQTVQGPSVGSRSAPEPHHHPTPSYAPPHPPQTNSTLAAPPPPKQQEQQPPKRSIAAVVPPQPPIPIDLPVVLFQNQQHHQQSLMSLLTPPHHHLFQLPSPSPPPPPPPPPRYLEQEQPSSPSPTPVQVQQQQQQQQNNKKKSEMKETASKKEAKKKQQKETKNKQEMQPPPPPLTAAKSTSSKNTTITDTSNHQNKIKKRREGAGGGAGAASNSGDVTAIAINVVVIAALTIAAFALRRRWGTPHHI